jgi:hypothetical protein
MQEAIPGPINLQHSHSNDSSIGGSFNASEFFIPEPQQGAVGQEQQEGDAWFEQLHLQDLSMPSDLWVPDLGQGGLLPAGLQQEQQQPQQEFDVNADLSDAKRVFAEEFFAYSGEESDEGEFVPSEEGTLRPDLNEGCEQSPQEEEQEHEAGDYVNLEFKNQFL